MASIVASLFETTDVLKDELGAHIMHSPGTTLTDRNFIIIIIIITKPIPDKLGVNLWDLFRLFYSR